jgi:hypothetical protein
MFFWSLVLISNRLECVNELTTLYLLALVSCRTQVKMRIN